MKPTVSGSAALAREAPRVMGAEITSAANKMKLRRPETKERDVIIPRF
jgi:hypothetical protein